MEMCSSVQTTSPKSSAAQKLAARLSPVFTHSYDMKTDSFTEKVTKLTKQTPLKAIIAIDFTPLPVPLADLTDLRNVSSGWIRTRLTELIDKVDKFLNDPSHYIHSVEHDRIMNKFDQDLQELNEDFDEMFNHDFEGKYQNDIEFKQEIKEEYYEKIVGDLITDYQTLIDAEEIFFKSQSKEVKFFVDSFESFSRAWEASLTPEQKAAYAEEEASLMW